MLKNFKRNFLINLILLIVLIFNIFLLKNNKNFTIKSIINVNVNDVVVNINIFDLDKPLEPADLYNPIPCRKSAHFYVNTTLCVHDLEKDVFVSGSIWKTGVWEPEILKLFTNYLNENPDCLVLDVGAQIGEYSLFAAKMGHDVLTVEPFYDNILRIHKAAKQESLQSRIKLIKNAISNKRNEIKLLAQNDKNIGGQSLIDNNDRVFFKNQTDLQSNKYLVETILFDDIIPHLPKQKDGSEYKKTILKIDIEGFEPYAFQNASNLFNKLDVRIIFMEWGNIPQQKDNKLLIIEMIDFLFARNFIPYGDNLVLKRESWTSWPWDIVWRKN